MAERPGPTSSPTSPDVVRSFRRQLTVGEDAVDVTKWFPESYGIPPLAWRVRTRNLDLVVRARTGWRSHDRGSTLPLARNRSALR